MNQKVTFFILLSFFFLLTNKDFAENLSSQGIADLSRPGVLQIGTHVTGKVVLPNITVDARARSVTVLPDEKKEINIDEYFSGSGFVIQEEGFIATNAHVVSIQTIKRRLATERALSALYENALTLSDEEMDVLLKEDKNGFISQVFEAILNNSTFELSKEVRVLNPKRTPVNFVDSFNGGEVAEVLVESPNFLSGGTDIAVLKINKKPAPALGLSTKDLAVGDRVYLSGFPETTLKWES